MICNRYQYFHQLKNMSSFPINDCIAVAKSRGFTRFKKFSLPFIKGVRKFQDAYNVFQKLLDADPTLMMYSTDPATNHFFAHPSTTNEKFEDCIAIAKGRRDMPPYYVFVYKTPNIKNTCCPIRVNHPDPPSVLDGMLKNLGKHDETCIICYEKIAERAMCMQCTAVMCMPCYRKNNSKIGRCPQCRKEDNKDDEDEDEDDKNRYRVFFIVEFTTFTIPR